MKKLLLATALLLLAFVSAPPDAVAQTTCATRVVQATGGAALLEGGARSKARNAWMKRVTESKRLGPSYAAWLRAKNPTYACVRTQKAYTCTASAIPCKV